MNKNLQVEFNKLKKLEESFIKLIKKEQKKCKHESVLMLPWEGDNPRRICEDCGFEEVGSWWSSHANWNDKEFGDSILGNKRGRSVTEVSSEEFYKHRLPK